MQKKQFIAAGILTLAFVGLVFAVELTPKPETASHSDVVTARISELERKIDVQERLISNLRKQLKNEKEKNRRLEILCKRYNVPQAAYRELMHPKQPRPDGAVEVLIDKDRIEREPHNKGMKYKGSGKPLGITAAKVGETGWLYSPIVVQVIDDANAIVKIRIGRWRMGTHIIPLRGQRAAESIRKGFRGRTYTVWLKGISTKDAVNGGSIKINHLMKITGTTTYETAVGSNTIFVIEKTPYRFPKGYNPEKKLRKR